MLEVRETLRVGAEEFFSQLLVSVLYDIKSATGEEAEEIDLYPGYRYEKKMKNKLGSQGDVTVEITEFSPPLAYGARFESAAGTNQIHYQIEPQGEGQILVAYSEGYDGDTKSQTLNYKLVSALYKRGARKRTISMLHAMEDYIQKNRKPE